MGIFPRVTNPSAAHPEGRARLACVRPAASVRSEPGSNSQVESHQRQLSLTSEPLHILRSSAPKTRRPPTASSTRLRIGRERRVICLTCIVSKENEAAKTVKLTPHHRPKPRGAIYRRLIHRNEPNRPHISSDTKLSKSTETKSTESARFYLAQPDQAASNLSLRPFEASSPVVPSPAASPPKHPPRRSRRPAVRLSAAGEGLSTGHPADPQPLSHTQTQLF